MGAFDNHHNGVISKKEKLCSLNEYDEDQDCREFSNNTGLILIILQPVFFSYSYFGLVCTE